MTYDPYYQRRQQPPKRDYDDGYDVAGGEYFNKTISIMPVDEEVAKQKEQTKPSTSELARREKTARIVSERNKKPFGGYPSIADWCKANGIKEHVYVWRSQSLRCRGFKREDIFKGAENKAEEKLDEITQFENKESAKKTTTDDYLDKLGQKYNESRIGDLEVEVKQLHEDVDNIKAMIAKLVKGEFAQGAGNARLRKVIKQLLKEILVELDD